MVSDQQSLCRKHGAEFTPAPPSAKVGIALNVREGLVPIHGLRIRAEPGTTGWFIWAGADMSEEPDFFAPLHVSHLEEWCPQVLKFLGLPPGWRFLVAGEYEDVWQDPNLLTLPPAGG